MKKISFILILFTFCLNCYNKKIDIQWETMCQVPSRFITEGTAHLYIEDSSYIFVLRSYGEGYIIYHNTKIEPMAAILDFKIHDKTMLCVEYHSRKNHSNKEIKIKQNIDSTWLPINIPLEYARRAIYRPNYLLVLGFLGGTDHLIKSTNNGLNWEFLHTTKSFKDFEIVDDIKWSNEVVGIGSLDYEGEKRNIVIFDMTKDKFVPMISIRKGSTYLKVSTKGKKQFGIFNKNNIILYSYQNSQVLKECTIDVPYSTNSVTSLFIGENFYIITGNKEAKHPNYVSWISFDKGKHWLPYKQKEKLRLLYSEDGELFAIDQEGNILKGITTLK